MERNPATIEALRVISRELSRASSMAMSPRDDREEWASVAHHLSIVQAILANYAPDAQPQGRSAAPTPTHDQADRGGSDA